MEEKYTIRRKWVKRCAIIFFVVLLFLTFFSNTIMNYSLPQVSTQPVESGKVSEKVRGSGVVEAENIKEIKASESREVAEVLVSEGSVIKTGDVLIRFRESKSEDIVAAEEELQSLRNSYYNSILVNEIEQSLVEKAEKGGDSYDVNRANLSAASDKVKEAQKKVEAIQGQMDDVSDMLTDTEQINQNLTEAQRELDKASKEHDDLLAEINTINDLKSQYEAIVRAQENLNKLKENSMENEIKAPVDGTISGIEVKAGDITVPDMTVAAIQENSDGYSLSFSVTNQQAKKVKVGNVADISNAWYYDDVTVTLRDIKADMEYPGRRKLLIFHVTGDVVVGETLTLSLGDKSPEYDYVVSNSAVREDNNGTFILIVKQKSSPLGNRYVAERIDVEVLAKDDSKTAVSGALEGGEYVITTSNKMIEPGNLVRLAD